MGYYKNLQMHWESLVEEAEDVDEKLEVLQEFVEFVKNNSEDPCRAVALMVEDVF